MCVVGRQTLLNLLDILFISYYVPATKVEALSESAVRPSVRLPPAQNGALAP